MKWSSTKQNVLNKRDSAAKPLSNQARYAVGQFEKKSGGSRFRQHPFFSISSFFWTSISRCLGIPPEVLKALFNVSKKLDDGVSHPSTPATILKYALHFQRYSDWQDHAEAEERARAEKLGLWSEPQAKPPWEWRRDRRKKSYI